MLQDDGIMDQDIDGDVAINLSTSQRPSAATTPNEGIQPEDVEQVSVNEWKMSNDDERYRRAKQANIKKICIEVAQGGLIENRALSFLIKTCGLHPTRDAAASVPVPLGRY